MLESVRVLKLKGWNPNPNHNPNSNQAIFANHSARPNAVIEHWPRMGPGPTAAEQGGRHRLEQEGPGVIFSGNGGGISGHVGW